MEPLLWCLKYQPRKWEDFKGNEAAMPQLRNLASSGTLPNMIFYGPFGTGKTSAAEVFAREILGDDFQANFMSLNIRDVRNFPLSKAKRSLSTIARMDSEERTYLDEYMSRVYSEAKAELKLKGGRRRRPNRSQMLHKAIEMFASTITVSNRLTKILVLDEADALDNNMQQALRRTMEIYNDACRFILITPSLAGWSPAIISRCLLLRFPRGNKEAIEDLIGDIAEKEDVIIQEDAIAAIYRESSGDYRRAINLLQMASSGTRAVTEDDVYECSETYLSKSVREAITKAIDGSFINARKKMVNLLAREGYEPEEVIVEIHRDLLRRPFPKAQLYQILARVAEIDFRITQARNPFIQFSALLGSIQNMASSA
ncbi:MAG: AAA family ATPase [Candidatus Thorarchaeota archaeon]|nr:AAA family ATPase [Candidatus Thorarchaeota archaeon]